MNRRSWTAKRKLAVFEAHGGCCHICGGKIQVGDAWELEHLIPLAIGGDDDESNVAPAHLKCHRAKTAQDVAQIAKANRVRAKHFGASAKPARPMQGSKASPWKKKLNGQVVRRDQIQPIPRKDHPMTDMRNTLKQHIAAVIEGLKHIDVDSAGDLIAEVADEISGDRADDLINGAILDGIRWGYHAAVVVEMGGGAMLRVVLPGGIGITHDWASENDARAQIDAALDAVAVTRDAENQRVIAQGVGE